MLLRSLFILPIILLAVYSCDAPRLNPLDPQNPDHIDNSARDTTYTITGNVKTLAAPSAPIANVNVYWPNDKKFVQTNSSGDFSITNLSKKDGMLYFEKEGYYNDSTFVQWNNDSLINESKFMKTVPSVNYFSIYTEIENSYNIKNYRIGFNTEISDKDDVVDSVIIQNKELKIYKSLPRLTFNAYGANFKIGELSLKSIEDAVGRNFMLVFVDENNNKIITEQKNIIRIISQEIEFIEPINQDTVSSTPTFIWKRFRPGFPFHYLLQIYSRGVVPSLVSEIDNINSDDISYTLTSPLDNSVNGTNEYFWVIWCIDEFGNKSRSKEANFIVE